MKLPWVSRLAFETAWDRARSEHENAQALRHQLVEADHRYDRLLDSFTQLRLAGAVEPAAPIVVPQAKERDQLETLIAELAGGDVKKHRMMVKQLRKDRAAGMSDEEITMQVLGGMAVTDGVPV